MLIRNFTKRIILTVVLCVLLCRLGLAAAQQSPAKPSGDDKTLKTTKRIINEGRIIIDHRAKLVQHPDDNRWFLAFETKNQRAPKESTSNQKNSIAGRADKKQKAPEFGNLIEVLPGKWLATMVKISNNKTNLTNTFRVWGEITVYNKRNFILPSMAATESLFGKKADSKKGKTLSSMKNRITTKKSAAGGKVSQETHNNLLKEQLRKVLLEIPRTRTLEMAAKSDNRDQGVGSAKKDKPDDKKIKGKQVRRKDGQIIKNRLGRLILNVMEQRFMFVFESDADTLAEPPVYIHPNAYLEDMENKLRNSARSIQFRVSGVISNYQGKSFILLRKELVVPPRSNLGK